MTAEGECSTVQDKRTTTIGAIGAGVDQTSATSACGSISAGIPISNDGESPDGLEVDEQTMQAVMAEVADSVGCHVYPSKRS